MNDPMEVRFKTSIASHEPRFAYEPGETFPVERKMAERWIASGVAEPVKPARSGVETASVAPRVERRKRRA